MFFKKYFCFLFILSIFSFNKVYSQSIGIVYEGTSFNLNNLFYHDTYSQNGMIKNIFVNYNAPLGNDFMLSTRVGYGWDNNESVYGSGGDESVSEENINGFPVETEIKYKHFIERVSVFEPTIGVGIGYYNYTAKLKSGSSNETELITKGFGQYITFGMNIHISKSIVSSIQFKKIMINSISTERDTDDSYIEKDYVQGSGINDLSISLGIFYNINSGK